MRIEEIKLTEVKLELRTNRIGLGSPKNRSFRIEGTGILKVELVQPDLMGDSVEIYEIFSGCLANNALVTESSYIAMSSLSCVTWSITVRCSIRDQLFMRNRTQKAARAFFHFKETLTEGGGGERCV